MPRESRRDKALRYIAEDRVQVLRANEHGIRIEVRGSRRQPYTVRFGAVNGAPVAECDCTNGESRATPTCSHIAIAQLLWRL